MYISLVTGECVFSKRELIKVFITDLIRCRFFNLR